MESPNQVEASTSAPAPSGGPPRRRYRAVYKPLVPVEGEGFFVFPISSLLTPLLCSFVMQFPAFQIAVIDRQKRPVFTSECLVCPELGRAPTTKEECADHDHSLAADAIDHVKALLALAMDSRLPLQDTCIIVPITQRRTNLFSLKLFAPPEQWVAALRNMGIVFDVTADTRATLKSEYDYGSVVPMAKRLLQLCHEKKAVPTKMGTLDFLRAPDSTCSSVVLFGDSTSDNPELPMPVSLADREQFHKALGTRMSAARLECVTAWSVAFFFFDGSNMYGGLKIDEGVFQRMFGCSVELPPQMKSRDDVEKKQKLRWVREDNVRFEPKVKMSLVYENVRREATNTPKKCSFFFEKGYCKNGKNCRFLHSNPPAVPPQHSTTPPPPK